MPPRDHHGALEPLAPTCPLCPYHQCRSTQGGTKRPRQFTGTDAQRLICTAPQRAQQGRTVPAVGGPAPLLIIRSDCWSNECSFRDHSHLDVPEDTDMMHQCVMFLHQSPHLGSTHDNNQASFSYNGEDDANADASRAAPFYHKTSTGPYYPHGGR